MQISGWEKLAKYFGKKEVVLETDGKTNPGMEIEGTGSRTPFRT
jgi:hypothetical protein